MTMEFNLTRQLNFDFKYILMDEIALEGLQGIDIDLLWRRVENRTSITLTEKMKKRYWDFISSSPGISFYELNEPAPYLELKDRFKIVDEDSGHLRDPDDYLDGPYEYQPVENEYGACVQYNERKLIKNIPTLSYDDVIKAYNNRLVMVASIEERCKALAPHAPMSHVLALNPVHYCLLELIGRSRENGQMTIGKTNVLKFVKDSKMLFYLRKVLKELDLIRVTRTTVKVGDRGVTSLLLRLRRFHKSIIMSMPTVGPLHQLKELLIASPNYTENVDNVFNKGILAKCHRKKFHRTYAYFDFCEKEEVDETKKKKVAVKRRYVSISTKSDSSSDSEEESNAPVLKCQYQMGTSLVRQAYMRLYESGLKGLTQLELSQLLGTEFYTSRNICRMLKSKKLVKEVYEDKGRQRVARLILTNSAANNINVGYEDEWQKLSNYSNRIKQEQIESVVKMEIDEKPTTSNNLQSHKIPADIDDWSEIITEIKRIEGLEGYDLDNISLLNTKRNLTLRQLKYANGIIQVVSDKLAVAGYQALNATVSAEIKEPQMDTRALKVFLQKLSTDGLIKIYKLKWPNEYKYTNYICAAHVTIDHPKLKEMYGEILEKLHIKKEKAKIASELSQGEGNRSLLRYAVPKFSKVRKFHEFVFKRVYCEDVKRSATLPEGFEYLIDVIRDMTIEFALGNVSLLAKIKLTSKQVNDTINMKLKDVPEEVSREILYAVAFRNTLRETLRILAYFGLVQIVNQSLANNFESIIFYVNRHAKIVNTTGSWPRPDADVKKLESEYYLGSMEDVSDFWDKVVEISGNTTVTVKRLKRDLNPVKPPVRAMNEVQQYDTGNRLGDGKGACGFHSSFYVELPRLWRLTVMKTNKSIAKTSSKSVQIPKLQRIKKRKQKKKANKILATEKIRERIKELKKLEIPVARGQKQVVESWTRLEDLIIVLCKVAITIMGPISHQESFRLKNMVAKDIVSTKDPLKTIKLCHLRAQYLDTNSTWAYEKQRILNEFKQRRKLFMKYDGLLRKLKTQYVANITKYLKEAKLAMVELTWVLLQMTRSESFVKRTPCVASNMQTFHESFTISDIPDTTPHKLYNMPNATDHENTLKESIMLTVAMSYGREVPVNIAKKIYLLFKEYPETTLRKSIEELRKSHAISAREKVCNNKIYKMNLQDLVECSYKLSAGYYRKWICKLNQEFLDLVGEKFDIELPIEDVKGDGGLNCYCCELHEAGLVELSTYSPPLLVGVLDSFPVDESLERVADIESNYKLRSGSNTIKNKTDVTKISLKIDALEHYVEAVASDANVTYPSKDIMKQHEKDDIVIYLNERNEKGSTFSELKEYTKSDTETLLQRLQNLEVKHIIKRVGFYDNRIVHIEYAKSWAMTLDRKTFLPSPWITLYGTLRREIFLKWANVITSKIFENPGSSIAYLSQVCELISAKSVQDICNFLLKCECVTMKVAKSKKVDLFSDDETVEEFSNYNPYESPNNILVFPNITILIRYASIRRQLGPSCGT